MAYARASEGSMGGDNSLLIIGGLGALWYLWYKGYFSSLGVTPTANSPTSVNSGATQPSVSQIASSRPVRVSPSVINPLGPGVSPLASGLDQGTLDLANESYYTWLASGEPLSKLAEINAAYDKVHNYYEGVPTMVSSSTSPTSVNSGAVAPSVNQVATPTVSPSQVQSLLPGPLSPSASEAIANFNYASGNATPLPGNIMALLNNPNVFAPSPTPPPAPSSHVASGGTGVATIPPPASAPIRAVPIQSSPELSIPRR